MSPWTIRNKPIKPKERLKILLMMIFWSDPAKYPFVMVRPIKRLGPESEWFRPFCLIWPIVRSRVWTSNWFDPWLDSSKPCLQLLESQKMNSIQAKVHYARTHQVGMSKQSVLKKSWLPKKRRTKNSPFLFISFTFNDFNLGSVQFWILVLEWCN